MASTMPNLPMGLQVQAPSLPAPIGTRLWTQAVGPVQEHRGVGKTIALALPR